MISARAPGKLFIAGEYAVVTPGEPAILVAVDRYVTAKVSEAADSGSVSSQYYRQDLSWIRQKDGDIKFIGGVHEDYVTQSIRLCDALAGERDLPLLYYDLKIESELDDGQKKFGLGSSAAVTVAVITALNDVYGLGLTNAQRYKIALLATLPFSPQASGGDIVASVFGGWVLYTSPNREAVVDYYAKHGLIATLEWQWPNFSVEQLPHPSSTELVVGWTGAPAITSEIVAKAPMNAQEYQTLLHDSRIAVKDLAQALRSDNTEAIQGAVRAARLALHQFDRDVCIGIETAQLQTLWQVAESYGAAAKTSGAGGGDCGVVLANRDTSISRMLRDWKTHGITHLPLSVTPSEKQRDDRNNE